MDTERELAKLRTEVLDLRAKMRLLLGRSGGYANGPIRLADESKQGHLVLPDQVAQHKVAPQFWTGVQRIGQHLAQEKDAHN